MQCPVVNQFKSMNKQEILDKIETLEVLADMYSRSDWHEYHRVKAELDKLNKILLDIINRENEAFLQSHSIA